MKKLLVAGTGGLGLIATQASGEMATNLAASLGSPEQSVTAIADIVIKIAIGIVTLWHLIKKPKPKAE